MSFVRGTAWATKPVEFTSAVLVFLVMPGAYRSQCFKYLNTVSLIV